MFRSPLRRDPLLVCWAVVMAVAAFVALNNNTTWSGHLDPARVGGFLRDLSAAFLWSLLLLLLAAWLRSRPWGRPGPATVPVRARSGRNGGVKGRGPRPVDRPPSPLPWTDRWLRDWREAEAQPRTDRAAPGQPEAGSLPLTCRHGVPVDAELPAGRPPTLRALSVSHSIVRPGSSVSLTWCFQDCEEVLVDGRGGHPACGETLVRIDHSRRIEVIGRNRYGATPVATAAIVAVDVPPLDLPTGPPPPTVSLRTDVAAAVGFGTPIAQRLDEFWAAHERLRPPQPGNPGGPPAPLVGVPSSVIDRLRYPRRTNREEQR